MVQPFLPNTADAFDDRQASPEHIDFEILLLGYQRTGVLSGCVVSEDPVTPDLTVDVALGVVLLDGNQIAVSVQLGNAITTGDGSNPRVDLVSINSSGSVVITDGVAGAVPEAPAIPASSIPLAFVFVPASDTTIEDNQIVDKRVFIPSPVVPIRYVDPNGADTNDGRTELTAYATIQAAYDDLEGGVSTPREFVGEIRLLPGIHDVAGGVAMENNRVVRVIGHPRIAVGHDLDSNFQPVITTNNTATEHFDITDVATANGEGFHFEGITFDMDGTALTAAIRGRNLIYTRVIGCNFFATTNPQAGCWAIELDNSGSDNSWNQILRNRCRGVGLVKILTSGNSNVNRWNIESNVIFWNDDAQFIMDFANFDAGRVVGNNLEGNAGGIWIRDGDNSVYMGNSGEGVATGVAGHANAMYRVGDSVGGSFSHDNTFIGGRCGFGGAAVTTGIWIRFEGGFPDRNIVINGNLRPSSETSNEKNHVEDVSTGGDGNTIIGRDTFELSIMGVTLPALTAAPARLRDGMLWHRSDTEQIAVRVDGATRTVGLQDALEVAVATTLDWTQGVLNVETTAAARVVTLPDNAAFDGKEYLIHRDGANTVTVNRAGSDTVSTGAISITLAADGDVLHIISIGDGVWKIL